MNNCIYLSHFMDATSPNFGGTKGMEIQQVRSIERGDSSNKIEFSTNNHFGTHIDFPKHFIVDGKGLNDYSAADFVFRNIFLAQIPLNSNELLTPQHFTGLDIPDNCDFILVKTGYEKHRKDAAYWNSNPGLTPELGNYLKSRYPHVRCIGFDFISASAFQHREVGRQAHKAFLDKDNGAPILILEDMKLGDLSESPKEIIVSPLLVSGADGIQTTVFAFL